VSGSGTAFVGAVGLETSVTLLALARVLLMVVVLIGLFAAETKVVPSQKTWEGIAAVVV